MASTFNDTLSQGATWWIDIACKDGVGDALDITLHEKHFLLARRGAAEVDLAAVSADDNFIQVTAGDWTAGNLRLKLLPADHADLVPGVVYAVEIWTEAPDGTVYDQAAGTIELRASGIPLAS